MATVRKNAMNGQWGGGGVWDLRRGGMAETIGVQMAIVRI